MDTVRLKIGKSYRKWNGFKVGPMDWSENPDYPFKGYDSQSNSYVTFTESGKFMINGDLKEHDLVAEWVDEEVATSDTALPSDAILPHCGSSVPTATHTDDFTAYFERQVEWSLRTFGPAPRTNGVLDHIRKELTEIEQAPYDLMEWVDVAILAMDGFHRHGGNPKMFLELLERKQQKNFARDWPDWRTMSEDQAIEHDRSGE